MAEKFGRRIQDGDEPRRRLRGRLRGRVLPRPPGPDVPGPVRRAVLPLPDPGHGLLRPVRRPGATDRVAAAAGTGHGTRFLVLSFDSDWRFATSHSRRIVRVLERARVPVTFREISAPHGHDSFLLDVPDYLATVAGLLDHAAQAAGVDGRGRLRGVDACVLTSRWSPTWSTPGPGCSTWAAATASCSRTSPRALGCSGTGVETRPGVDARGDPPRRPGHRARPRHPARASSPTTPTTWSWSRRPCRPPGTPPRCCRQIARIAGRGIVSVPNFGLWQHRAGLLLRGRMPVSVELPLPVVRHAQHPPGDAGRPGGPVRRPGARACSGACCSTRTAGPRPGSAPEARRT